MTRHTDEEFEISRKACHIWQETAGRWEARALKAEAVLAAQPASPLRGTLWGQIAAIYEGANDVDATWVDREWMKMRKLSASPAQQPDAPNKETPK